jgi:hypothetical protein
MGLGQEGFPHCDADALLPEIESQHRGH